MKSTLWKVLTVSLAAAAIACVSVGCTGGNNAQQSSKTSSSASSEVSEDSSAAESKTDSETEGSTDDESKTEESKSDESKAEESKAEESNADESEEESAENSDEESTADDSDASTETGDINPVGCYEYNVGDKYIGLEFKEDGTLNYRLNNGYNLNGTWSVEDGTILVRVAGGAEEFTLKDGNLYNSEGGLFSAADSLSVAEDNDSVVKSLALSGTWESNSDDNYTSFTLNEDGTGVYMAGEDKTEFLASWEVSDGVLNVHAGGGVENLVIGISSDQTGVLTSTDGTRVYHLAQ